MCSIAGCSFYDPELIRRMNAAMAHRGPDATGVWTAPHVSFGHNRLSIIDLSERGSQPMHSVDGRFTIVFNGEIYNYRELRAGLSYPFRSESDTEVILALYALHGAAMLPLLNGIFAFAIWDREEERLFLARDQMGVKPLYYAWDHRSQSPQLVFASEIKGILESGIPRRVNLEALECYLRLLYVPAPLTLFEGISKLPPGCTLTLQRGQSVLRRFWDPLARVPPSQASFSALKTEVRSQLMRAVERQLVSDRPVGLYLSGGIDSSALLDCMREIREKVVTFSVGYALGKSEEEGKFNADQNLARQTARQYGTEHHEISFSSEDFLSLFEEAMWHLDEPVANSTALPMLKLARMAKSSFTVALGGDGGDELFGGYPRYRMNRWLSLYLQLPEILRTQLQRSSRFSKNDVTSPADRFFRFMLEPARLLKTLVQSSAVNLDRPLARLRKEFFRSMQEEDFEAEFCRVDRSSWLVDESLLRSDKLNMAAGIEARVPFLDLDLVRFADSIPLSYKVGYFQGKRILREAFRGRLPEFLFQQPKRGWFSPIAKWLRRPQVTAWAKSVLSPSFYPSVSGLFAWNSIHRVLDDHVQFRTYNRNQLLALLAFQVWAKRFGVEVPAQVGETGSPTFMLEASG